jgi:hypothetical protein
MIQLRSIGCILLLTVCAVFLNAQAEHLKVADGTSVTVHRATKPSQGVQVTEDVTALVHPVHVVARHPEGMNGCHGASCIFSDQWTHNLRTAGGGDWQAIQMASTGTLSTSANYIALTNNSATPLVADCANATSACALSGEITTNGLSRAQGTYAHTLGTAAYTVAHTFTATGTQASQETGLFNVATVGANPGVMSFEADYTAVTVNNGDTLTITWTVNY